MGVTKMNAEEKASDSRSYFEHAKNVSRRTRDESEKDYLLKRVELATSYIKHISTISTGSIFLLVTLLDKLFKNPEWKALVGVSLVGFMLTIVCGVITFTTELAKTGPNGLSVRGELIDASATAVMWLSFISAIGCLVVFGLKNLF